MRFRIGYGGPEGYRHGYRNSGPRGSQMSEFERFLHLIISLQILFGTRRGGILYPLLVIGLAVAGWFAYQHFFSIHAELRKADTLWDSGDSTKRNQAVREYKEILQKKSYWDPATVALETERDRLYRRIIQHHVLFDDNVDDARDWIKNAWDERYRLRDMNFGEQKVIDFWNEVVDKLKRNRGKFTMRDPPAATTAAADPTTAGSYAQVA